MAANLRTPAIDMPDDMLWQINMKLPHALGRVNYIRIHYWETGCPEIRYIELWRTLDDWDQPLCASPGADGIMFGIGKDQWDEWLNDIRARRRT